MSFTELLQWWRYYCECPFGYKFIDNREALNCAVSAAPYSRESLPLSSFKLYVEPEKVPTTGELVGKLHSIFGGRADGAKS